MNRCQLFCKYHCTHAKNNKKVCWQEIACFHAIYKQTNQEVNFDVKLRQCIVSKDHISMNNGDNFIKFAG